MYHVRRGGLASLSSIAAIVAGAWMWRRIARRPVHPEGSSRHVLGLAPLGVGLLLLAWRHPGLHVRARALRRGPATVHASAHDVGAGSLDSPQAGLRDARFGCAAATALWPKWVRMTAPVSTVAWATGVGLVLSQTLIG